METPEIIYGTLWHEQRDGKGEDAEPLAVQFNNSSCGVMAVLDGMGGAGSAIRELPDGTTHTDAYLASRFVREKILQFFQKQKPDHSQRAKQLLDIIAFIKDELDNYKETLNIQPSALYGNMTRILPTTLAMICWNVMDDNQLSIQDIWAGDSRNYILDERGLHFLSQDHTKGDVDAWESLREDPPIINAIWQNKSFFLAERCYMIHLPSILICCTDGCFGYLPSPIHFEKLLITTFIQATTMEEWMNLLKDQLLPISGDDFSLVALMNKNDWDDLKQSLQHRLEEVENNYIKPFDGLLSLQKNIPSLQHTIWTKYANTDVEHLKPISPKEDNYGTK